MGSLRHVSMFTMFGLLIGAAPLVMAAAFALSPSERRLALMRPLTLAAIFAAVCNLLVGVANVLRSLTISNTGTADLSRFAMVLGEALAPPFLAFVFLTVAWLGVAIGMRRLA